MEEKEFLWERYKHIVDVHKGYLDLVIKLNISYYVVTGAMLSFYFIHKEDVEFIQYSLVLPFVMSVAFFIFFSWGAKSALVSQKDIASLAKSMEFDFFSAVVIILTFILIISAILMLVMSIGVFILYLDHVGISLLCTKVE